METIRLHGRPVAGFALDAPSSIGLGAGAEALIPTIALGVGAVALGATAGAVVAGPHHRMMGGVIGGVVGGGAIAAYAIIDAVHNMQ
jgi:hypothetical protein